MTNNIINSLNCYNDDLYPLDWDAWIIKQPNANKEWIKEFNITNNIKPWNETRATKEDYLSIECRRARQDITENEYDKMNNHITDMYRLDTLNYFILYISKLYDLIDLYHISNNDYDFQIKCYFKILERTKHLINLLEICMDKICERHKSPSLSISNIKYSDKTDPFELKEKLFHCKIKELENGTNYNRIRRRNFRYGYFIEKHTEGSKLFKILLRFSHYCGTIMYNCKKKDRRR